MLESGRLAAWWTTLPMPGDKYRTYSRVDIEDLPPIPARLTDSLAWLSELPAIGHAIVRSDQAERPLGPDSISWLEDQGVPHRLIPAALLDLAADPELLAGIPSPTDCFVDLGSKVVLLAEEAGGGWLIRFLSDSQFVRSWLIHLRLDGAHRIVVTGAYLGYEWGSEPGGPYVIPDRPLLASDLDQLDVEPCANSLTELLARLWLEGETWRSLHGHPHTAPDVIEYERAWRSRFM